MTAGLRSRVRKLEDAAAIRVEPTLTDLLIEVEARRDARRSMTAEERAKREAAHREACIASLDEPDLPAGTMRAALQKVRRRAGQGYLVAQNTGVPK